MSSNGHANILKSRMARGVKTHFFTLFKENHGFKGKPWYLRKRGKRVFLETFETVDFSLFSSFEESSVL